MKIVCASSVLFAREAFETLGETVILPDDSITAADLKDADALIVRSKTPITPALIENTRLSFVGTATAGTDHMDTGYLNHLPLAWCAAPGCNANSVAEYAATALLCLANRHGLELAGLLAGVVGVGQVGTRVAQKLEGLGMAVLRNDPPLQAATHDPLFLPLEDVAREADVLTLHVPLTQKGPFPTQHLANSSFFAGLKPGCLFLNASRGEVVKTDSLLYALAHGVVSHAVLDVWEHEPDISPAMLEKASLGTPHIAGYSFEGRLNGTLAVYREACHFFEVEESWEPDASLFPPGKTLVADARGQSDEAVLWELVRQAFDIEADDRALRGGAGSERALGERFSRLRKNYPARREFPSVQARIQHASPGLLEKVAALGFQIAAY